MFVFFLTLPDGSGAMYLYMKIRAAPAMPDGYRQRQEPPIDVSDASRCPGICLSEKAENDSGRNCRTYDAGHVRCHGVHEQVVVLVELPADILRNAG